MTDSIYNYTDKFLGHFPLNPVAHLGFAGLRCFMLIWQKCNITHRFDNITININDRKALNVNRGSYQRGLKELAGAGLITVEKAPGRCNRISVNLDKIDMNSINFVRSGKTRAGIRQKSTF